MVPSVSLEALCGSRPTLAISEVTRPEVVLGAFQRAKAALAADEVRARALAVTRRVSGGPAVFAGPGTLHLVLALPRPDALVPCAAAQLANRYVRPLLAGLTKLGARAHYFGRDWISVAHRPASWIGWAHEAATGRCVVEALIAVTHPFALPPELDGYPGRVADPFLDKAPATIALAAGTDLEPARAAEVIADAYQRAYPERLERIELDHERVRPLANDERTGFDCVEEAAIGFVGARVEGARVELGGDYFASRDLVPALERALGDLPPHADERAWAAALVETLERGGFALEGLRDRTALCRVAHAALVAHGRAAP